jgi:hypothetical protein
MIGIEFVVLAAVLMLFPTLMSQFKGKAPAGAEVGIAEFASRPYPVA